VDGGEMKLHSETTDFLTGHLVHIEINGARFLNRERFKFSVLLDEPYRDANGNFPSFVEYTPQQRNSKEITTIYAHSESGVPYRIPYPGFLDTNKVKVIQWGGYSFIHEAWFRHDGPSRGAIKEAPFTADNASYNG
jgi:hypothetical protein